MNTTRSLGHLHVRNISAPSLQFNGPSGASLSFLINICSLNQKKRSVYEWWVFKIFWILKFQMQDYILSGTLYYSGSLEKHPCIEGEDRGGRHKRGGSVEGDLSTQVGKAASQLITPKSSLIIRSKEKGPGAGRGRGPPGLLQGSTCYYPSICLWVSLQGIILSKLPNP